MINGSNIKNIMGKDFTFIVSELLEHFSVTHRDLLNSSCRLFWFDHMERLKQEKGLYWLMFSKPYHLFVCGFERNIFFLRRNNNISEMYDVNFKLNELPNGPCIVQIAWGVDFIELDLRIGDKNKPKELKIFTERKMTPPSYPSIELIRWVDKQNLIEKHEYDSEVEFRNKIIAIIKGLQEKINISSNINEFWNIIKKGNSIVKRTPKDETDIQAAIIRMISDQLILANIFVSPEYDTGRGKVDMIFSTQVKELGICTIVMEIKNAHSQDLKDGLNIQLPLYMKTKKSKYGIYLILWYQGDWFNYTNYESIDSMIIGIVHSYLLPEYRQTSNPENITLEVLDLTKGITASKVKK
jgi:hypothetical protein